MKSQSFYPRTFAFLVVASVQFFLLSCKQDRELTIEEKQTYEIVNFFIKLNTYSERDTLLLDNLKKIKKNEFQSLYLSSVFSEEDIRHLRRQFEYTAPVKLNSQWLARPHRLITKDSVNGRNYTIISKPLFSKNLKKAVVAFTYCFGNEYWDGGIFVVGKYHNGWAIDDSLLEGVGSYSLYE